jgi:aspartate racemase
MRESRTIGILGGMGPQATMDLERRIHLEAQRRLPPKANEGYPPLVSVYLRHAPVAVDENSLPVEPRRPDPRLFEAVARLGEWADVMAIPSNTPHQFLDQIRAVAGCVVLDMIELTLDEVRRRDRVPVGITGLGKPHVYIGPLESAGVTVITPRPDEQAALDAAIIRLMEGRAGEAERDAAVVAVEELRRRGAAISVLGCSEIPLLLGECAESDDLINPVQLLAQSAVEAAIT